MALFTVNIYENIVLEKYYTNLNQADMELVKVDCELVFLNKTEETDENKLFDITLVKKIIKTFNHFQIHYKNLQHRCDLLLKISEKIKEYITDYKFSGYINKISLNSNEFNISIDKDKINEQ